VTIANIITLTRLALIPVFVGCAIRHGLDVRSGSTDQWWRYAAVIVFTVAAVSDGLDGFVARRFNQRTVLGSKLDPLADMLLLLSGIITLSIVDWDPKFPSWFPVLVLSRDILSTRGMQLIKIHSGSVIIRPHWTGKVATVLQMTALGWLMLRLEDFTHIPLIVPTVLAGIFVFWSGWVYLTDAFQQVSDNLHAKFQQKK
jgi:CDP-diacylglycerol--glycerol-3-phosphate 3-phosphatidyltransferase